MVRTEAQKRTGDTSAGLILSVDLCIVSKEKLTQSSTEKHSDTKTI